MMSKPFDIKYPSKIANHLLKLQDKEIENLNNIIYEIEMYIKRYTWLDGNINSNNLLDYIQKLKEGK